MHYALLRRVASGFEVVLDTVAADSGRLRYEEPFPYELSGTELIVFPKCYRGCYYRFFRLGSKPVQVRLEAYQGLEAGEYLWSRGTFLFESEQLVQSLSVSRDGDPMCCPTGGTLRLSYTLSGDSFLIASVKRTP